jgi:hypothetical protein
MNWQEDHDGWVWGAMPRRSDVTLHIYIVPFPDTTFRIIDTKDCAANGNWVEEVTAGMTGKQVAGPFPDLDSAKAAWRVIYA